MSSVRIRPVELADAELLARVQTESWKAAFAGIIPPDLLSAHTSLTRAESMYRRLLEENKGHGRILTVDGEAHCIAYWDASRCRDMAGYAELICIHSLPDRWRMGYGSMMMDRVLEEMRNTGFGKVMLWVFAENRRAIGFYQKHGFKANGQRKEALGAVEVMYERTL